MNRANNDWQDGDTRLSVTTSADEATTAALVPGLTVLAHPDIHRVGERVALPALALGHAVRLSRLEPVFRQPGRSAQEQEPLPLVERTISRRPIRLLGSHQPNEVVVDLRDTRTPVIANGEVIADRLVLSPADVERGVVLLLGRRVVLLLHPMRMSPVPDVPRYSLVGESDAVVDLRREIARLAPMNVPVLLRGESGTGKELVARALHEGGRRSSRPYVAVNMATLSPSLAAAELFGAARGAFTGADRNKVGLFRSARGGTLFLDEIGETPVEVQAMLLRALESGEILPVGSVEPVQTDVRVIAATDARLEEAMAEGRFRTPLYHRLAGYTVQLPPLRARRDDVGRLLFFFLDQERTHTDTGTSGAETIPGPTAKVVARLARHDWPGNVRELRNVARRLAISGADEAPPSILEHLEDVLTPAVDKASLDRSPQPPRETATQAPTGPRRRRRKPADVSEEELLAALEANAYRMRDTAEALDLSRIGLYRRLDQSPQVSKAADLGRQEIDDALVAAKGDLSAAALALRVSLQGLKRRITELRSARA